MNLTLTRLKIHNCIVSRARGMTFVRIGERLPYCFRYHFEGLDEYSEGLGNDKLHSREIPDKNVAQNSIL